MNRTLLIVLVALATLISAHGPKDAFFERLSSDAVIFTADGLVQGKEIQQFVENFSKENGPTDYQQAFSKEANPKLNYELGTITTKSATYSVMFLKQSGTPQDIPLLVIYEKKDTDDPNDAITEARNQWMKLCNAHQASELVKQVYTSDAYYYNQGRLLHGTEAISKEYSYMNNTSYSLKLSPLHVAAVTSEIVYEIGQCSGSYPGPYVLLWEKQADGNWQVLMDTNY